MTRVAGTGVDIARDKKKRLAGSINATAIARIYLSDGEFLQYVIHDAPLEGETIPTSVLQALFPKNGSSIRSCKIIWRCAEGAADRDWKRGEWPECAQRGQIDGFSPSALLSWPGCGAPGSAHYAAVGISGVRRMSPTVITRPVIPRAMAGVRSRYLPFKPGIGSRNDSCGRARW
jgi:hypothetical protein